MRPAQQAHANAPWELYAEDKAAIIMEAMEDVRETFRPWHAVMIDWPIITLEQREPIEYASIH